MRFIVPPAAAMLGVVAGLTMAAEAVPGRGVWYVHRVPFLRVDLAGSVRRAHGEPVYGVPVTAIGVRMGRPEPRFRVTLPVQDRVPRLALPAAQP